MKEKCRVSIFGAAHVGKTEIVNRFAYENNLSRKKQHMVHHHYQKPKKKPEFEFKEYIPTIEDFHIQCFDYIGFCLSLEIVDTCGTEQFPAMRKLNIERSKLVILVYDVTRNDTIHEAIRLYHIARSIRPVESGLIIMFVGAKSDLLKQPHKNRIIEEFTNKNTDIWLRLILCSAKTGFNIKKIFRIGFENLIPVIMENNELKERIRACQSFEEEPVSPLYKDDQDSEDDEASEDDYHHSFDDFVQKFTKQ